MTDKRMSEVIWSVCHSCGITFIEDRDWIDWKEIKCPCCGCVRKVN